MAKSFVLYSIIEVEGELVECVYFINGQCYAQPFARRTNLERQSGLGPDVEFYKPVEQDQLDFCKNKAFRVCPRFQAYLDHLKAIGVAKQAA